MFTYCECEALGLTLARAELWPATPSNPRCAFSFAGRKIDDGGSSLFEGFLWEFKISMAFSKIQGSKNKNKCYIFQQEVFLKRYWST